MPLRREKKSESCHFPFDVELWLKARVVREKTIRQEMEVTKVIIGLHLDILAARA